MTGTDKIEGFRREAPQASPFANPPRFLSGAFHLSFFPKALVHCYRRYRRRDRGAREHVVIEVPIVIAVCAALAATGFPSAVKGSVSGIVMSVVGAGGIAALVVGGIVSEYRYRARQGVKYTYEDFIISIFVFCLMLGFSAGLLAGGIIYESARRALPAGLIGLAAGYVAGIFAGRWIHCLGFMTIWFIYLANLATAFMLFDDVVMLFYIFK